MCPDPETQVTSVGMGHHSMTGGGSVLGPGLVVGTGPGLVAGTLLGPGLVAGTGPGLVAGTVLWPCDVL